MAAVLITGMSGTGKSTVLQELTHRGHSTVDTDHGPWIEVVRQHDGTDEPLWREDRIARLLDDHTGRTLFVGGCVANQVRFYPRFSAVVLLSVPEDVLLERLSRRTTNSFGKSTAERARILSDLRTVEPLLRQGATAEIDSLRELKDVADELELIAGLTTRRSAP
jgi:dephospho-CoA kinase